MNSQCQTVMKGAISSVLETMFFTAATFEEGVNPGLGEVTPYCCESSIDMVGDEQSLKIFVLVTERFGKMITANFLGVTEEKVEAGEQADTLKELANMVAGEVAVKMSQGHWRLGIPEFAPLNPQFKHYPGLDAAALHLCFDGEPMALVFCCVNG
jgi:hypothetical protein